MMAKKFLTLISVLSVVSLASTFVVDVNPTTIHDGISGRRSESLGRNIVMMMRNQVEPPLRDDCEDEAKDPRSNYLREAATVPSTISRRRLFSNVIVGTTTAACGCLLSSSHDVAYALAQITTPSAESLTMYDLPRNSFMDAGFARGMATGMVNYEKEAAPTKQKLFQTLFDYLKTSKAGEQPVIVEVGMGSFPNAKYYQQIDGLDIIGVDPNDSMEGYARDNAKRAGLLSKNKDSLRIVHGVSEALPFDDNSVDAVVCTLTLCSVLDPAKSVSEIKRILKPGGKFLFWEHVLSETDFNLAATQHLLTPSQVKMADGCHLDRRTGEVIRAAGFKQLDITYMELKGFSYLNPTVCGIATA